MCIFLIIFIEQFTAPKGTGIIKACLFPNVQKCLFISISFFYGIGVETIRRMAWW